MKHTWILIALVIIVIGFFYYGFKDDFKRGPKEFLRSITEAFLATLASFFFGVYGFSSDLFNGENEKTHSSK